MPNLISLCFYIFLINTASQGLFSPQDPRPDLAPALALVRQVALLKIDPLDIKLKELSGTEVPLDSKRWRGPGGTGGFRDILPCSDKLDVVLSPGGIAFMHEPGVAQEIFADPQVGFEDVACDSQHVWIATEYDGVWVVSFKGELLTKIGSPQGWPSVAKAIKLHTIKDGEVFVAAADSWTTPTEAWLAVLKLEGSEGKGIVFHHAARKILDFKEEDSAEDPALIFTPAWLHAYQSGDPSKHILLVGRDRTTFAAKEQPLEVDLKNYTVTVFPGSVGFADQYKSYSIYSLRGDLLLANTPAGVSHRAKPGTSWNNQNNFENITLSNANIAAMNYGHILPYKGWLYVPQSCWMRLNAESLRAEPVYYHNPDPQRIDTGCIPAQYEIRRVSLSAHYGFVAWSHKGKIYQLMIEEGDSSETGNYNLTIATSEQNIPLPAEKRQKKEAIVAALEQDRQAAPEVLAQLDSDPEKAVEQLVQLMGEKSNQFVRAEAAKRLGELGISSSKVTQALVHSTGYNDPLPVVVHSLGALLRLAFKGQHPSDLDYPLAVLPKYSDTIKAQVVPYLLEGLDVANPEIQLRSMKGLMTCSRQAAAAVPKLIEALQNPDPRIRENAAITLTHMGESAKPAKAALLKLLQDQIPKVVQAAENAFRILFPAPRPTISSPPPSDPYSRQRNLSKPPSYSQRPAEKGKDNGKIIIGGKTFQIGPSGKLEPVD